MANHSFVEFASWYTVTLCPTLLLPFPYITDFIGKTKINESKSIFILTLAKMICLNAAAWTPGTICLVSVFYIHVITIRMATLGKHLVQLLVQSAGKRSFSVLGI